MNKLISFKFSPYKPGGLGCCPFLGGGSVVVDVLFIVIPIVGVCNCSMFCCMLLYVHSRIAIILIGKRELIALLNLSSWCLVMVERLFLAVPRGCLQFVIVVFPDHTYLLFLITSRAADKVANTSTLKSKVTTSIDCVSLIIPNRSSTFKHH